MCYNNKIKYIKIVSLFTGAVLFFYEINLKNNGELLYHNEVKIEQVNCDNLLPGIDKYDKNDIISNRHPLDKNNILPNGVTVEGIKVGGMRLYKAESLIKNNIIKNSPILIIEDGNREYSYSYPEIGFKDNLDATLPFVIKNGNYHINVKWYLNGIDEQAMFICDNNKKDCLNAEVFFDKNGFTYESEKDGVIPNKMKLINDIKNSLSKGGVVQKNGKSYFSRVKLTKNIKKAEKTLTDLKKDTVKISEFSTIFSIDNRGRAENIAIASSRFDGITISPYEEFSFNQIVGRRTEENGFKEANIIQNGEYVKGVGGGVCQVSTTLYNAALLAGMKIKNVNPHSLLVSYVPASRDAMVSSSSDFVFVNNLNFPVYISAKIYGEEIKITFYGRDEGVRYKISSEVIGEITPQDPIVEYGNYDGVIREAKMGTKSVAYISKYKDGKLISSKKLRSDSYSPIRGILSVKIG